MSWWRVATDEPVVARGTLVIMGLAHWGIAAGLRPPYIYADLVVVTPGLAEVLFFLAGLLCFLVAVNPHSRPLSATALALIVMAAGTRAMALVTQTEWIALQEGLISIPPPPFFQWVLTILCELWIWPYLSGLVPLKHTRQTTHDRVGRGGNG